MARFSASSEPPKLAIVFASVAYEDCDRTAAAVREVVGEVPILGGTSGGYVLGPETEARRGVSVVLLGGDDIEIACRTARLDAPEMVDVVPAATEIAGLADEAAKRGLVHYACLVFAPGIFVDGEALVAAVRKGAGAKTRHA